MQAIKKILHYLKGTQNVGLWYPTSNNFELIDYSNANFARFKIDRKSIPGTCQLLGERLASWFSKK